MNMKGGTGVPFTAEIAYLGNRDRNNCVLQKGCSAQNSAKRVLTAAYSDKTATKLKS